MSTDTGTELDNRYSPLPALRAEANYGTSLSFITYLQHNYWEIPTAHSHMFASLYILHWESTYFRAQLVDGMVCRHGICYQVIYHRTNPTEIKKSKGAVWLSFRATKADIGILPVVLVSLDKKDRGEG